MLLLLGLLAWPLTSCGGAEGGAVTAPPASAPSATDPRPSATTTLPAEVDGPIDLALGIPMPYIDGAYYYRGAGRFVTASGREFFWRDGRFVNPDGTLLEVRAATVHFEGRTARSHWDELFGTAARGGTSTECARIRPATPSAIRSRRVSS